jgi:hypothetical protein
MCDRNHISLRWRPEPNIELSVLARLGRRELGCYYRYGQSDPNIFFHSRFHVLGH